MAYHRERLKELIKEKSLKFGDFTLASGKKAKYYLDGKQVVLDAEGAMLIGEGILELILEGGGIPEAVGGMAIGADPITASVITIAGTRGIPLKGCMVRKEAKDHGTQKFVEGPVQSGDHIVVVEDVVTTGGSSLLAIERLEAAGLIVNEIIAIIDRMEGGRDAFTGRGYQFRSLFTIKDFGIEPPENVRK
ncbi:MAG: orotate phosphoribosyltransferase [Planctomycetaceae bacterium]|jgi:orotate phosphoribosyltransferase|nr:orotate phosphoribosyltransferase [Planctomycetaceae bacterium]